MSELRAVPGVKASKVYPVSFVQRNMLGGLSDPSSSAPHADGLVLAVAIQVRPRADLRRLDRAFRQLLQRHDSLRIRFDRSEGDWRAVIGDGADLGIEVIDAPEFGKLDEDDFAARVHAIARRPMDILTQPVVDILLIRCGARGDVVVMRVHHAVTDGTGMFVLVEDLFRFLLNMPVVGPAVSHGEFVANWQLPKPAVAAVNEAYWAEVYRDFPMPPPGMGRRGKGLQPLLRMVGWRDSRVARVSCAGVTREALEPRAAAMSTSVDALLYTAYLQALCVIGGVERVACIIPIARVEPELARFCGCRVILASLAHRRVPEADFARAAAATQAGLTRMLAHLPARSAYRGSPADQVLAEAGAHPNQFEAKTPLALSHAKRSVFRSGLDTRIGEESRIGHFRLKRLDADSRVRTSSELSLDLSLDVGAPGEVFNLAYDVDAYTHDELTALAQEICRQAGLEMTGIVFT